MNQSIDKKSQNILNFKPVIEFVEPKQRQVSPSPIKEPVFEETPNLDELNNLATTVEVLATVIQDQIDKKAKDVKIKLDPSIDAAAIQAMLRLYPDKVNDSPMYITYQEYKECKDKIIGYGEELAEQAAINPDEVEAARNSSNYIIGGFGTAGASDGSLRPELSAKATVVKPINFEEFQADLIKVLMNTLWRTFIRPPLAKIPFAGKVLPKQLPKLPKKLSAQMKNIKKTGAKALGG